ncbi:uncharacterized protein F4807DRAFT_458241 [Annulohypoxylon truncatum]|uniref:uncharacterized protein n=1 Tax=Annulohypoxylon truncatum TaxID=327061 RepID=UPI002007A4F0|nr:uncharacterized protein F4807DRAFT_458241 [Annulohypoxylon truncatum]KAI1212039.1 hypothetical protein F4807DRAFT_458241 [Annulohypoxylon truncatum]
MSQKSNVQAVDQELRSALIRTNIALLQREIREKKDWYTTRRVVVRKRNGRIHLSRLGSQRKQSHSGYTSEEEDESQNSGFTLIDEPPSSRSTRSSFGSVASNFA